MEEAVKRDEAVQLACKESKRTDPYVYYRQAGIAVCMLDLDSIRLGFSDAHVEAQIALLKCERR